MTDVYRTEGNPFASAIDEVRRATAARDVVREAAWQAGLAEARIALRDFGEVIAPVQVSIQQDGPGTRSKCVDIDAARVDRVCILLRSSPDHDWVAQRIVDVVWDPAAGRWLRIGAARDATYDGTLADILLDATREVSFGNALAAVSSAKPLPKGTEVVTLDATTALVCPRQPTKWADIIGVTTLVTLGGGGVVWLVCILLGWA